MSRLVAVAQRCTLSPVAPATAAIRRHPNTRLRRPLTRPSPCTRTVLPALRYYTTPASPPAAAADTTSTTDNTPAIDTPAAHVHPAADIRPAAADTTSPADTSPAADAPPPLASTTRPSKSKSKSEPKSKSKPESKSKPKSHPQVPYFPLDHPNSAIIIPASIPATTPDHIIAHIEPLPHDFCLRDTRAIFFVTPAFAHWLLDDDIFLKKALARLFQNTIRRFNHSTQHIHSLCAVVDKLPAAYPSPSHVAGSTPPNTETGCEGVAYTALSKALTRQAHPTPENISEQAFIDFIVRPAGPGHKAREETVVQLPLANTVFQTGRPSTMIHSIWKTTKDKRESPNPLTLCETKNVSHHEIRLNRDVLMATPVDPTLNIPLVPLTFPRKVDGHMGNILRQVVGKDGQGTQASAELEHAVPAFFKARGEPVQSTLAWALVIPNQHVVHITGRIRKVMPQLTEDWETSWKRYWANDPIDWSPEIERALKSGARLHRVLSGGGGWGKKAGLLSLDPGPRPGLDSTESSNPDAAFGGEADFTSALRTVIREGDWIQFFISPTASASTNSGDLETLKRSQMLSVDGARDWEFGVVPSTVDSIPGGSWQYAPVESNEVIVFKGTFGALTEKGLTWRRRGHRGNMKHKEYIPTTIDVPFSRFSASRRLVSLPIFRRVASLPSSGQPPIFPDFRRLPMAGNNSAVEPVLDFNNVLFPVTSRGYHTTPRPPKPNTDGALSSKARGDVQLSRRDKTPSSPTAALVQGLRHLIHATSQKTGLDAGLDLLLESSTQQTAADTKAVLRLTRQVHHLPTDEQKRIRAEIQRLQRIDMPDKGEALGLLRAIARGQQVPHARQRSGEDAPALSLVHLAPSLQNSIVRRKVDRKYEGDDKSKPTNEEGKETRRAREIGGTPESSAHESRRTIFRYTFDSKFDRREVDQYEVVEKIMDGKKKKQKYRKKEKVQETHNWNKDITHLSALEYYGDEYEVLPRAARNPDGSIDPNFDNVKIWKRTPEPTTTTTSPSAGAPTNTPLPSDLMALARANPPTNIHTPSQLISLAHSRRKRNALSGKRIRRALPTVLSAINLPPVSEMPNEQARRLHAAILRRTRTIALTPKLFEKRRPAQALLLGKIASDEHESTPVPFATESSITEDDVVMQQEQLVARRIAAANQAARGPVRRIITTRRRRLATVRKNQAPRFLIRQVAFTSRRAPIRRVKSGHQGLIKRMSVRQWLVRHVNAWLDGRTPIPRSSNPQPRPKRVFGSGHLRDDAVVDEDDEGRVDPSTELEWGDDDTYDVQRPGSSFVVRGVVAGVEDGARWEIKTVQQDKREAEEAALRELERIAEKGQRKAEKKAAWEAEKRAKAAKKDRRRWGSRQKGKRG